MELIIFATQDEKAILGEGKMAQGAEFESLDPMFKTKTKTQKQNQNKKTRHGCLCL